MNSILMFNVLNSLPYLLVYLVGIILSFVFFSRSPRSSVLCLAGCSIGILARVVATGIQMWFVYLRTQGRPDAYGQLGSWIGFAGNLAGAFALVLILVAVVIDRPRR